jgi:GntR family transcriptional regulator
MPYPTVRLQDSPQPLYLQIKEVLKQRILDGQYAPNQKLASENELMAAFGVSRITVRQALRDLHTEGLVFSAQGKGTFVSKPKATQSLESLQGFEESMLAAGFAASSKLLSAAARRPPKEVGAALRLGRKDDVIEIKRLRYLNREPISIDVSYFPADIGTRLIGRDLARDLFPMLENELGVPLGHADVKLGASVPDAEAQKLLRIGAADPLLRVERLTHDASGRPVDFEYLLIRGDAYQYQFRIHRRGDRTQR